MIAKLFGERKCFSHQTRYTLAQCTVKSFNVVGPAAFFANCPAAFAWKNFLIGRSKIRIRDKFLPPGKMMRKAVKLLFLDFRKTENHINVDISNTYKIERQTKRV